MKMLGRIISTLALLVWSVAAFAQVPNMAPGTMVPNAAGGGGTFTSICGAGSATTQLLYNNAGACGGITGWTTNGTTTLTGGASTTLAIGGATIGSNALAVTGTAAISGTLNIEGTSRAYASAGVNGWNVTNSTADVGYFNSTGLHTVSSGLVTWQSTGNLLTGAIDATLSRSAAGVLQVGTTAANALGSLNLTNLTATGAGAFAGNVNTGAAGEFIFGVVGTTARFRFGSNADGNVYFGSGDDSKLFNFSVPVTATLQLGAADVASGAVAQTLQVQSNTGTTTTGPDFSIVGSGGTSVGGNILIKVKATTTAATVLTLTPAGLVTAGNTFTTTANQSNGQAVNLKAGALSTSVAAFGFGMVAANADFEWNMVAGTGRFVIHSGFSAFQINTALTQFGGSSASFPALKRSTTILQARLADDTAYAPFEANTLRTATAYTVSTLPAAGTAGRRAYVTDQLTTCAGVGVALTGGGAVVCPAFDNGVAWVGGFLYMPGVFGPRGVPANDNSFPMQMTG